MTGIKLYLLAKSGVYSSAPGSGQAPEGFGAVLLYAILGAFCGLLAGLMTGQIARYIAFLLGRSTPLHLFAIGGALAGATLVVFLVTSGDSK